MFATNQPSCKVCGMKYQDIRFNKDINTGAVLYWSNPALSPEVTEKVEFCGPEHATQFWKENVAARNGEAEGSLDQP